MIRALSLILIIIMLFACVYALFGEALTEPFIHKDTSAYDHAFSVDQFGNVFYIHRDDNHLDLMMLDSAGVELLRTDISSFFDGHWFIDDIYVLQNKNILVTGYEFIPETLIVTSAKIAAFHEDGSFIDDIFRISRPPVFKDSRFRFISSFSEDERNMYFAVSKDAAGNIDTYAFAKDGSGSPEKTGEYKLDTGSGGGMVAFHALPGGGVVFSLSDGSLVMQDTAGHDILPGDALPYVYADRFWSGAGVFYMRDAVSGTIFSSPNRQLRPGAVISLKNMHEVAVGGVGNVLGIVHTTTDSELYLGSFSNLSFITTIDREKQADMTDWFIIIAVAAGIIIASVLIWEFFTHFMRMKMSLIIKYTLLTAFIIFCIFFILLNYILIPAVTESLDGSYRESLASDANVLLSAMATSVEQGAPATTYRTFIENFGNLHNQSGRGNSPVSVYLLARENDEFTLVASSGRYMPGITLNSFLPYAEIADKLSAGIARVTREGDYTYFTSGIGRQLAVLRSTGIRIDGAETFLCLVEGRSGLENTIGQFTLQINRFLMMTGSILTFLLIISITFHTFTLKRLSRILRNFESGNYHITSKINPGDETGDLLRHIKKLSTVLLEKETNLQILNDSYHRFIPDRFLKLMGETRVEKINKNMQTRLDDAYIFVVRFSVLDESNMVIFANSNMVLENIVPVVAEHGGTVYNYLHNGFDGVFEKSAVDALTAALSIRDICRKLNKRLAGVTDLQIDLRIVLTKADITLGFVGDKDRIDPTAISDFYPQAEALMNICFGANVFIAATGEFYEEVKDKDFKIRKVGKTAAGNKTIDLYDIFDSDPPALFEVKKSFAEKFELGVNLFAKGDYRNAGKMFMDIIKHSTEDGIARNYLYLSEYNVRNTDKQLNHTVFEDTSSKQYFNTRSDTYYSNSDGEV